MHTAERAAGGQVRAGPASRASLDSVCRHRGHTVGRVRGSLSSLKQRARSSLQGLHNFSFLLEHLSSLEIFEQAFSLSSIQPESGSRMQLAWY